MKRIMKLIFILPLLFVVSVKANTIDLKGNYFDTKKLYKSGDIYTNLKLHSEGAGFFLESGPRSFGMAYIDTYNLENVDDDLIKSNDPNKFYVDANYLNVFDVPVGNLSEFRIPKIFDYESIWLYRNYNGRGSSGSEMIQNIDYFINLKNLPEYTIKCNKSALNVGDFASCDLYLNNSSFVENWMEYETFFNYSYSLISDDYNIDNIDINEDTGFIYDNGIISGRILKLFTSIDSEDELYDVLDRHHIDSIVDYLRRFGNAHEECLKVESEIDHDGKSSKITGDTISVAPDSVVDPTCLLMKYSYDIKVASFDITPKHNVSSDGFIGLSDINMSITNPTDGTISTIDVENTTYESIPITGLVKGVEENPKTGLFNYIMLIIPVSLFIYGLFLLKKRTSFKGI